MDKETQLRLRPIDILNKMKNDLPVFVGFSTRGPLNEPLEIKRWGQFIVKFGSFKKSGYLATSVNGFFINGGKRFLMLNLGERPQDLEEVKIRYTEGLKVLDDIGEIPFIVSPGEIEPKIHEEILKYCEGRGIYALFDGPEELVEKIVEPQEEGEINIEEPVEKVDSVASEVAAVEAGGLEEEEKFENMPEIKGENGLVIYPWIYLKDRVMGDFYIPPAGHAAGILCRLFNENKRPEFSTINGTVLLRYKFSAEEIERYTPRGISFLRYPTKHPGLMLG